MKRSMHPKRIGSDVGRRAALVLSGVLVVIGVVWASGSSSRAQDPPAAEAKPGDATGAQNADKKNSELDESEASLGRRYQQFERTLLQMAEYLRKTEPERADLLIRAIGRSKENRIGQQMDAITQLLKSDQFGDAIGHQEHLIADLKGLLELLQSEDRRHQLEQEKEYYEMLHKEVGKLAAKEKDLRAATQRGGNFNHLGERQGGISRDAQALLDKIDKQDASKNGPEGKNAKGNQGSKSSDGNKKSNGDQKPGGDKKPGADSKSDGDKKADADKNGEKSGVGKSDKQGDAQNADKKNSDKKNADKKDTDKPDKNPKGQQESGSKKNGGSQSKSGKNDKSQKQPGQGQPNPSGEQEQPEETPPGESESQPQDQATPQKTPGRKELDAARRAMKQAEDELKRLQGKKAVDRQDEAIRKLAEARAQLEKVLRQLREEEQQIILASLEARFAKMLVIQLQIHVDTIGLSKTPTKAWTVKHFGRSRELSVQEDGIADDAGKALTLLKEEGSSVAFPKGVEQVRDDMLAIARRLSGNDVAELTQSMERDVIESLEEMVAALQAEIEKRKPDENQRRRGQRGQNGDDEKELVQQLSELKMLRSLQYRVNRRTKQIGRLIRGEQAGTDDLMSELTKLARRQAEIQEATYIIATGRNR
jgi:hypothetical protein